VGEALAATVMASTAMSAMSICFIIIETPSVKVIVDLTPCGG
jgi:hypothetical protein